MTTLQPLTHHEILGLIEPFTRHGRHVDLAATNRIERRLVFKPIVHAGGMPACDGAREILQLENPRPGLYRLIRTLTLREGVTSKLTTDGHNPGDLLARIETVPPQRQFQFVADIPVALSYRLEPTAGKPADGTPPMRMALTSAEARLDGLTLALKADTGSGYPAEIVLLPQPDRPPLDLPDDLLATLGWDWKVLSRRGMGWTGALRAPRREPARSRHIESAMGRAVTHLARTLAEPPRRFHDRLVRARWTVVFRRMIPLLASVVLIAIAAALAFADIPQDSMIVMMSLNLPPLMLVSLFCMREMPRFEIPPPPRPSKAPSWFPLPEGRENSVQPVELK